MSGDELRAGVCANVAEVRARMAAAARDHGRDPAEVRLVAVTKYVETAVAAALLSADCTQWGESRPQDLWHKHAELPGVVGQAQSQRVEWHLIGHLQRNKVARTLPLTALIHSVDSLRLAKELHAEGLRQSRAVAILLEVNVSGDAAKQGFAAEAALAALDELAKLSQLDVRGLMAMSGLESDAAAVRREFAALRSLRDRMQRDWHGRFALNELSMGMSGDFEAAIAEGATLVRIGSALFEGCL